MRAAFPDMKHTPQLVLVNGRTIFAVNLVTGTQDGTLKLPGMPDVPATHKKIGFLMAHKLTINDENKATEEWAFFDPGTMMGQLGLLPKDAPAKRAAMDKGWDGAPNIVVAADDAKEKANVEGVQKGNEAFSAHKAADLEKWVTDDFVESDQTQEKDSTGKKDMEKNLKELFTAFSDIKATADVWGAGDYVVSLGTLEGTNDHDVGKMKKTGKHVSVKYVEVFQLKDGKASHLWRFMNSLEFAKQLGLMPAPGEAPKGEAPKGDAKDAKKPDAKKPAKK
jgi:predicted ester cyclase